MKTMEEKIIEILKSKLEPTMRIVNDGFKRDGKVGIKGIEEAAKQIAALDEADHSSWCWQEWPKNGDKYYVPSFITDDRYEYTYWQNSNFDNCLKQNGLIFRTEAEAKAWHDKIVEFLKQWK